MKSRKYGNKSLLMIVIVFIAPIYFLSATVLGINNEEHIDEVEKIYIDKAERPEMESAVKTVESSDEQIITQIGKKELKINSYYYTHSTSIGENAFVSTGKESLVKETWTSDKPKKEYTIGVLLPLLEDKYWITADYGIVNYAKELGVKVKIYSVGGYIEFGNQKEQLRKVAKDNTIDGIIFAALDNAKFDSDIASIVNDKPVVELVNNINSSKISAKAIVSYYEMGYKAGKAVLEDASGKNIKIAFFPGPEESGWAPDTFKGFKDAISVFRSENQEINISEPYYGDTRPSVQRLHIRSVLENNGDYDYIVGCAPAAIEAEKFIASDKDKYKNIKIVSTYISSEVYNSIKKGSILAAPSDQTIDECRISLDMIVKILNGKKPGIDFPFTSGLEIPVITQNNISQFKYEDLFGTKDYIPVLNHMTK